MNKEGYVTTIINDETIVINLGERNGVSVGDDFLIYENGPTITDPITDENLGNFLFAKETVQVVVVDEKFSICQKITHVKTNSLEYTLGNILAEKEYTETVRMNVNDDDNMDLDIRHKDIAVKDPVKKIV